MVFFDLLERVCRQISLRSNVNIRKRIFRRRPLQFVGNFVFVRIQYISFNPFYRVILSGALAQSNFWMKEERIHPKARTEGSQGSTKRFCCLFRKKVTFFKIYRAQP